ncbi:MAG: M1 family metallopeptidase, partial [Bacteroidota bacterium]
SNAQEVSCKHLQLAIQVDFEQQQLRGCATWEIENKDADELHLDTDQLSIDSVLVDAAKVVFQKDATVPHLGERLRIPIQKNSKQVAIYYKTGTHPRALQWLTAQQTLSKTKPFLYTQSESIYARSWIPCPDGPGIRFTYDARVQVPLGFMALMSAENPQSLAKDGQYQFHMPIAIPAYLMALAVGDIAFKAIDARTGVYAEPTMIAKAANEFSEVGKMVSQAEKLYGPYRWGRYDMLVLPPGFPIGGMENPKLTFCTPTIIAGDKSLVNLIAHELAHNWSGNLVTNATWNDFWLNEGFTVYFERRLTESLTDKSYADMLWELGYQDLEATLEDLKGKPEDTKLKLNLAGRDPDDGLNDIAYEKGALFLRAIELKVGRTAMDTFLNQYFNHFAFKTITTEQFLDYLKEHLLNQYPDVVKDLAIEAWVYGAGVPKNAPRADQDRFKQVNAVRTSFLESNDLDTKATQSWTTHEYLHFLRLMPKPLAVSKMQKLDELFHFTQTGNAEIADLWFIMSVAANYMPAPYTTSNEAMRSFLSSVGRRKFIVPLYKELMAHPYSVPV